MIVNSFGYSIVADKDKQPLLTEKLHALACEHLNLCAGVGCSCITGTDATPLCYESKAGDQHPVHHSEGPTWSIALRCLPTHVILDIHTYGLLLGSETADLYYAICRLAEDTGCGAVMVHNHGTQTSQDE